MKQKTHILLDKIEKKNPFTVPENYFENFALQMESKIASPRVVPFKRIKSWMYAAAVFAGIVVYGSIYYTKQQNEKNAYAENYESYVLSQIDESSMIDYYVDKK